MTTDLEEIAEELAEPLFGRPLFFIRTAALQSREGKDLREVFRLAGIVRYFRIGADPAKWFGETEEILKLFELSGVSSVNYEQRKAELAAQAEKITGEK